MKITKIEQQKKNLKRYSIYLDGEFNFGVHEDVLVKSGLHVDQILDESYIEDILKKEEQSKANHYALNLISYRVRSKKEIYVKMNDKGYELDIIETTISFLIANGLLDDYNFSLMFLRDKLSLSRHSLARVKYDLKQKGVSKDIIQNAIFTLEDEEIDFDFENAKYHTYKKYKDLRSRKKNSSLSEYELKQKVYHSITQKGFNIYTVKDALEEALREENV